MNGILVFCLAYGLIELTNAIYLFQKNKMGFWSMSIIVFWGMCIFLIAIDEIYKDTSVLATIYYFLFGVSWLLMLKAPCSVKIFHEKNKYGPLSRKVIFIILSISQFVTAIKNL